MVYSNPRDELKAIYLEKTGQRISKAVLMRFFDTIEVAAVPIAEAMDELRTNHVPNAWSNPDGFLTHFARNIRTILRKVEGALLHGASEELIQDVRAIAERHARALCQALKAPIAPRGSQNRQNPRSQPPWGVAAPSGGRYIPRVPRRNPGGTAA